MSEYLKRFRDLDAVKFVLNLGTPGIYTRAAGGSQGLTAIFRSPIGDNNSTFAGLTVENSVPSILFRSQDLTGANPVHSDTWKDDVGVIWIVDTVSKDAPQGWTRLDLSAS